MLSSVALGLAGCAEEQESAELTTQELIDVLGIDVFEVAMPEDLERDRNVGLALRSADGTIKPLFKSTHWPAGVALKLTLRDEGEKLVFGAVGDGENSRIIITLGIESKTRTSNTASGSLPLGTWLRRYSSDGTITSRDEPDETDTDLIFTTFELFEEK